MLFVYKYVMDKLIDSEFPFSKVKKLLESRGVKIKWLASNCGVSPDYMSSVLSGRKKPSVLLRVMMASTLDYNEADLVEVTNHAA